MFFWSEDEARAFRREEGPPDGTYLTMEQAGFAAVLGQVPLFDIDFATRKPRR